MQEADRILVIDEGRLREEGTHSTLIDRGGIYKELAELQFARSARLTQPQRSQTDNWRWQAQKWCLSTSRATRVSRSWRLWRRGRRKLD